MDDQLLHNRLEQLRQHAEAARSDGLFESALEACTQALELLRENPEADEEERQSTEFLLLLGDIYWSQDELEEALRCYEEAALSDPDSLDAPAAIGIALFHLCRFNAARAHLERLNARAADMADVWHYLGLLAERTGETSFASMAFRKAFELDPEMFPLPLEMDRGAIEVMLSEMMDQLPKPLHDALENVPILLEDLPGDDVLFDSDPPLDPLSLGLFVGVPLTEQSVFTQHAGISRILLFRKNIERIAANPEELERELWITFKHEIGHFWGLSEEQLAEMGLE